MIYIWQDKITKKTIEVDRKMIDSHIPPSVGECRKVGFTLKEYEAAEFTKVITGGAGHIGFGAKGYW
jgi:hypothetical protein